MDAKVDRQRKQSLEVVKADPVIVDLEPEVLELKPPTLSVGLLSKVQMKILKAQIKSYQEIIMKPIPNSLTFQPIFESFNPASQPPFIGQPAMLSVTHGPHLPLPLQHHQVDGPKADLGDLHPLQHPDLCLLEPYGFHQPNRPTAPLKSGSGPDTPLLSESSSVTSSSTRHHHLPLHLHHARHEATALPKSGPDTPLLSESSSVTVSNQPGIYLKH